MVCSGLPCFAESAPSLRSLSGKTLDVQGRKIVLLDCGNGHSLSVQFYVCTGIPFPLVSVARLLLQDFWTVMAKDYLALIDPMGNPVPIVRQGTLVYLCPNVIPYAVADAARMAASCLPDVMDGVENELGSLELRGVTDMEDGSIDHLFQIGALIAAAQEMKAAPGQSESLTVQDLLQSDSSDRAPAETVHEPPELGENAPKKARIDPDAPATEPVNKQMSMRISALHHIVAGDIPACKWLASIVGVEEVVGKDGTKIDVEVNAEEGEIEQEMRLAEPLLWESGFPPAAEKKGMMKEMNSMKEFDVYDEVLVKDCTEEQVNEALDCRWVKVWKNETDLRCRVVLRGCFQNVEKNEEDNLFASTPSLVTMRLLLCMAMSRNWAITLGDVSTAFLHALMSGEVYVWPPKEFYPNGDCLWRLKKAMYGLRQAPKLRQEHFADVMISKLGFRRCKSDPNLYCRESGKLYVLAYVDDLLVVGTDEMRKDFMSRLSEEDFAQRDWSACARD